MSSTGTPDASDEKWFAPQPNMSIDSRGWNGPVWSPDGTQMLAIYEGQLGGVAGLAPHGRAAGAGAPSDQRDRL